MNKKSKAEQLFLLVTIFTVCFLAVFITVGCSKRNTTVTSWCGIPMCGSETIQHTNNDVSEIKHSCGETTETRRHVGGDTTVTATCFGIETSRTETKSSR